MRKITRHYHDYDPVSSEHWSIENEALLLPNNVIVFSTDEMISFEQLEHIEEGAESVSINATDKKVKVYHIEQPDLIKLAEESLEKFLGMTMLQAVNKIFKKGMA